MSGTDPGRGAALITGAARGIGRCVARALAEGGHAVGIHHHRSGDEALALAAELRATGVAAEALQADLSQAVQAERLAREAREALGPVTIVVNNASSFLASAFEETGREVWMAAMEIHLLSPAALVRAFLPDMRAARWGRIVNMGDMMIHAPAPPRYSAHVAAKSSLLGLTRALAEELGPEGITANFVSPAVTRTESTESMAPGVMEQFARACPVGRVAEPDEVASVVAFLCSEEASFLNGVEVPVTGGWRYL